MGSPAIWLDVYYQNEYLFLYNHGSQVRSDGMQVRVDDIQVRVDDIQVQVDDVQVRVDDIQVQVDDIQARVDDILVWVQVFYCIGKVCTFEYQVLLNR